MTRFIAIVFGCALIGAQDTAALDVTACGTTVPARETGVLVTDLDCSGTGVVGVRLLRGATLELNGHTIVGGPSAATIVGTRDPQDDSAPGRIVILGPGVIAGTAADPYPLTGSNACIAVNGGRAQLEGDTGTIEVSGCVTGIAGGVGPTGDPAGRLVLRGVTIHDNWSTGAQAKNISAETVTVYNHARQVGLSATATLRVSHVTAHHRPRRSTIWAPIRTARAAMPFSAATASSTWSGCTRRTIPIQPSAPSGYGSPIPRWSTTERVRPTTTSTCKARRAPSSSTPSATTASTRRRRFLPAAAFRIGTYA
jgi:hypothetical protein